MQRCMDSLGASDPQQFDNSWTDCESDVVEVDWLVRDPNLILESVSIDYSGTG